MCSSFVCIKAMTGITASVASFFVAKMRGIRRFGAKAGSNPVLGLSVYFSSSQGEWFVSSVSSGVS